MLCQSKTCAVHSTAENRSNMYTNNMCSHVRKYSREINVQNTKPLRADSQFSCSRLFANDGLIAKEYNVLVKVSSPKIDISTSILDFGHITIDLPLEKQFTLKNLHSEEVHWQLFEFTYDFKQKKLVEIQSDNILPQSGIFKRYGEIKDIVYHVTAKVKII